MMGSEIKMERDRFHSRSRSRSPFRKNFNERSYDDDFRRRDSSPDRRNANPLKNRVFVNNIPFECRWMELKDLFRDKVGDVSFVELFEDDCGSFKGCGLVEFKTSEAAKKAVDVMHKHEIRGRQLNVKMDSGEGERKRTATRPSGREFLRPSDGLGNHEFRSDAPYNTYGLNPEFLRSLGISGPLNNKVFISNLDYKVTEKKLEEIFKIAGKLVKVELNSDSDGKSKGFGTAEYEHPLEAVQAISMFNGQRLYARIMNVRMDKFVEDDALPSKLPSGLHGIGKGLGVNGQPMQFHKSSSGYSPVGNFGMGLGVGGMSGSMSSGGIGVGSSNMGMLSSSGMGSMSMNSSMSSDRMMGGPSLGMGMNSSSMGLSPGGMGMGSSTSMMSSNSIMGRSSMDNLGRESSFLGSEMQRGFRDGFDIPRESFSSSTMSDTILLGNLPSTFSWQTLKDRIREIGDVRFAELKGQGNALIRFGSCQEAQRAVDLMNGFRIEGRAIQARLY